MTSPRLDIDRVKRHRHLCRQAAFHHVAFAGIAVACRHLSGRCVRIRSWGWGCSRLRTKFLRQFADDHAAREQSFIGIQAKTGTGTQLCILNDLACRFCIDVGLKHRFALEIKDLSGLFANNDVRRPAFDDLLDLLRLEVVGRKSAASRENQLVARVAVLMKIK